MKRRTAWILAASVAAVALGAALVGGLALVLRGRAPGLTSGDSYLYLALDREVPEQPPREIETFLERRPPSLRTLVESLDRAGRDTSVRAVVVRLGALPDAGWGKAQELPNIDPVTRAVLLGFLSRASVKDLNNINVRSIASTAMAPDACTCI